MLDGAIGYGKATRKSNFTPKRLIDVGKIGVYMYIYIKKCDARLSDLYVLQPALHVSETHN